MSAYNRENVSAVNFLNVAEAAEFLRVSASFLNKLRVTGGGPNYIKVGRRVVYSKSELGNWLDARKFVSTSAYSA